MKKPFFLIAAALLTLFTSCQKETIVNNESNVSVLKAVVEQQVEQNTTKTYLENKVVKWSADDQIKVFYSSGNSYEFSLVSGQETSSATFTYSGEVSGTPQYAIYPYSSGANISGSTISFNLPSTQTYKDSTTFGEGSNVAVAEVSDGSMTFKNVCGSLKLQLKGNMTVKKIELSGKNEEKLNGAFKVNMKANPFVGAVPDGEPSTDEQTITLDCGEGIELDSEESTAFYFIVPVGAFSSGFTAKITDTAGDSYYGTVETYTANTIVRSIVKKMPDKGVSMLPSSYTELAYLESTGGQSCSSGVNTKNTLETLLKVQFTSNLSSNQNNGGMTTEVVSGNAARFYLAGCTGGNYQIAIGEQLIYPGNYKSVDTEKHHFFINFYTGAWRFDNIEGSATGLPAVNSTQLTIFARGGVRCYERVFFVRIKDGSDLVSYLVPAKDGDGNLGLYNVVTDEFYQNTVGGDNFTAGPVVN